MEARPPAQAAGAGEPPAPGPAGRASARTRRPGVVTFLALLQFLGAITYGSMFAVLLVGGPAAIAQALGGVSSAGGLIVDVEVVIVVALVGGLFVASLAAGVLLLRMSQLGWTITMLLTGFGLATSILLWWAQGATIEIWVMAQVLTVFYLNQRQVRVAFGISRREAAGASDEAPG